MEYMGGDSEEGWREAAASLDSAVRCGGGQLAGEPGQSLSCLLTVLQLICTLLQ